MIEFKADCGHTVRARDEDGGGVVRCSYCGKPASVPENNADDLDFLFTDVEQGGVDGKPGKKRRGRAPRAPKRKKAPSEFNPFAVVLRLCYAALLIIIVLVVGQKFIIPLFKDDGIASRESRRTLTEDDAPTRRSPRDSKEPKRLLGWTKRAAAGVLYAESVPVGAVISCIKADKAPPQGPISGERDAVRCLSGVCKPRGDGIFVVEVALPVVHPELKHAPGYYDFRRELRDAKSDKERNKAAERFFIPDGSELFVMEDRGQTMIVRQYRDVELRPDRPTAIRSLFLPRIPRDSGRGFSIDTLVHDEFIPTGKNYLFDEEMVRADLKNLYDISAPDCDALVVALHRIGSIPFRTPNGKTRLFSIDVQKGWLADAEIIDPAP